MKPGGSRMKKVDCLKRYTLGTIQLLGFAWMSLILALVSIPGTAHAQEDALRNLKETGKAFATVAREASPSVVFIKVEKTVTSNSCRVSHKGYPNRNVWSKVRARGSSSLLTGTF
jgi:S1-C subfamily serine protease